MLDDAEWAEMEPLLKSYVARIRAYRKTVSPEQAHRQGFDMPALELYYQLTGLREANVMNLWHHRLSLYGPPCLECGKPLRTPVARICAACGTFREIL
jgi:hypothetical protein